MRDVADGLNFGDSKDTRSPFGAEPVFFLPGDLLDGGGESSEERDSVELVDDSVAGASTVSSDRAPSPLDGLRFSPGRSMFNAPVHKPSWSYRPGPYATADQPFPPGLLNGVPKISSSRPWLPVVPAYGGAKRKKRRDVGVIGDNRGKKKAKQASARQTGRRTPEPRKTAPSHNSYVGKVAGSPTKWSSRASEGSSIAGSQPSRPGTPNQPVRVHSYSELACGYQRPLTPPRRTQSPFYDGPLNQPLFGSRLPKRSFSDNVPPVPSPKQLKSSRSHVRPRTPYKTQLPREKAARMTRGPKRKPKAQGPEFPHQEGEGEFWHGEGHDAARKRTARGEGVRNQNRATRERRSRRRKRKRTVKIKREAGEGQRRWSGGNFDEKTSQASSVTDTNSNLSATETVRTAESAAISVMGSSESGSVPSETRTSTHSQPESVLGSKTGSFRVPTPPAPCPTPCETPPCDSNSPISTVVAATPPDPAWQPPVAQVPTQKAKNDTQTRELAEKPPARVPPDAQPKPPPPAHTPPKAPATKSTLPNPVPPLLPKLPPPDERSTPSKKAEQTGDLPASPKVTPRWNDRQAAAARHEKPPAPSRPPPASEEDGQAPEAGTLAFADKAQEAGAGASADWKDRQAAAARHEKPPAPSRTASLGEGDGQVPEAGTPAFAGKAQEAGAGATKRVEQAVPFDPSAPDILDGGHGDLLAGLMVAEEAGSITMTQTAGQSPPAATAVPARAEAGETEQAQATPSPQCQVGAVGLAGKETETAAEEIPTEPHPAADGDAKSDSTPTASAPVMLIRKSRKKHTRSKRSHHRSGKRRKHRKKPEVLTITPAPPGGAVEERERMLKEEARRAEEEAAKTTESPEDPPSPTPADKSKSTSKRTTDAHHIPNASQRPAANKTPQTPCGVHIRPKTVASRPKQKDPYKLPGKEGGSSKVAEQETLLSGVTSEFDGVGSQLFSILFPTWVFSWLCAKFFFLCCRRGQTKDPIVGDRLDLLKPVIAGVSNSFISIHKRAWATIEAQRFPFYADISTLAFVYVMPYLMHVTYWIPSWNSSYLPCMWYAFLVANLCCRGPFVVFFRLYLPLMFFFDSTFTWDNGLMNLSGAERILLAHVLLQYPTAEFLRPKVFLILVAQLGLTQIWGSDPIIQYSYLLRALIERASADKVSSDDALKPLTFPRLLEQASSAPRFFLLTETYGDIMCNGDALGLAQQ